MTIAWPNDALLGEESPTTQVTAQAYPHITRHIVDSLLTLVAPSSNIEQTATPLASRFLTSISAKLALYNEIMKPDPDLRILQLALANNPDASLAPRTECVITLLDRGHIHLADTLLIAPPPHDHSSPDARLNYLVALTRLGRFSSGLSSFRIWQDSIEGLSASHLLLAAFQLGLWQLEAASRTFADPRFPCDTAPGLQIARQLLRYIAGHDIPHADLELLRNHPGLSEHAKLNLGVLYRELGLPSLALELLPANSTHLFAQINRAITLARLGNDSAAEQALEPAHLPASLMNGQTPSSAQMQELAERLALSYGQTATTPYFHFMNQLSVARLSFPRMPLRELLPLWHTHYVSEWRRHPEGSLIPTTLSLPESVS